MTPRRLEIYLALCSGTFTKRTFDYSDDLKSDIQYLEEVGLLIPGRLTVRGGQSEEFIRSLCYAAECFIDEMAHQRREADK